MQYRGTWLQRKPLRKRPPTSATRPVRRPKRTDDEEE